MEQYLAADALVVAGALLLVTFSPEVGELLTRARLNTTRRVIVGLLRWQRPA